MEPIRNVCRVRCFGIAVAALTYFVFAVPLQAAELAGSEWQPTKIGDMPISKDADIFVRFEAEGKLKGHSGCNGFFGTYRVAGTGLEIGPLGATNMACPEPVMDREGAFMKALQAAKTFKRDRITLELKDDGGTVIMELAQRDAD